MNGPPVRTEPIYVEVLRESILLKPVRGGAASKAIRAGEHAFLLKLHPSGEEWAVLEDEPRFGLPLELLRGLQKARSIDVAFKDGRSFFNV